MERPRTSRSNPFLIRQRSDGGSRQGIREAADIIWRSTSNVPALATHLGDTPRVPAAALNEMQLTSFDGSEPSFRVGENQDVKELLAALDWVRADYTETGGAGELSFSVSRTNSLNTAEFYDHGDPPLQLTGGLGEPRQFALGMLGLYFRDFRISAAMGPVGTTWDLPGWQTSMSIVSILRRLNSEIAVGNGAPGFQGLAELVLSPSPSRIWLSTNNPARDAANALLAISPNGVSNVGESANCLIGNDDLIRTMMNSTAGQTGLSGWRTDTRTGLFIYHFLGVPVYRTAIPTTFADPDYFTTMYAANLGPTGLQLVYGYGSLESFGLQADVQEIAPMAGTRDTIIHGAFGLVLWEREGLAAISQIPVVPPPAQPE